MSPGRPGGSKSLPAEDPRVLLVGYNGANNTGAEALLLSDIEDVRAVLGPGAHITVPTLNEANLRRYLKEGPNLRIARIPSVFFAAARRLVREHDLVMLVEGSTYMDTWGSPLLWAFLWVTACARAAGKPTLAYAVDAGDLSSFNRALVRRVASRTDLIVTRNRRAAERLRSCGVTAPIEVTADNAFHFRPDSDDEEWARRQVRPGSPGWPEWPHRSSGASGVVGMALVDFHLWPVVVRPWGRKEDCYRWPFYFSRSPERSRATEALARCYAALADSVIERHGKYVALICMEQLDEPFARQVHGHMAHPEWVRVFSSREYNASRMAALLQSLDLLVTSRYHASVLSLPAQVPQVAVGHDYRLDDLYRELDLREELFVDPRLPGMLETLQDRVTRLVEHPDRVKDTLRRGYKLHLERAGRNRELLRAFVEAHGWGRGKGAAGGVAA